MKKILILLILLNICTYAYGARATLENGTGTEVGTSSNPIVATLDSSSSVDVASVTVSGTLDVTTILTSTGSLTIGGTGGSNNENLLCEFESDSGDVILTSSSGADLYLQDSNFRFGDDDVLEFGNGSDVVIHYETTGNDYQKVGLVVGSATAAGMFGIMEKADNRSIDTTFTDPTLRIYSADETEATDYIEMYHNQSDGIIGVGYGQLLLLDDVIIGIDDTNPKNSLHVVEDDDTLTAIRVDNTNATTDIYHTGIELFDGSTAKFTAYYNNNTDHLALTSASGISLNATGRITSNSTIDAVDFATGGLLGTNASIGTAAGHTLIISNGIITSVTSP